MTFAIAGLCRNSGMLGVAITTSSIAVGSRCPFAQAGTGAVSTQNVTLPSIGPDILDEMSAGHDAGAAVDSVMQDMEYRDYRQVIAIDSQGRTASFTGDKTLGCNAVTEGRDCIAGGNLLKGCDLPCVMSSHFEVNDHLSLPGRLVAAIESGLYDAGGEEGPVHSAALYVVDKQKWPLVDLRVDWDDDDPVARLRSLWNDYEPQMIDYVLRALRPDHAPSYGVPGDR